jgi:hypothetical protein
LWLPNKVEHLTLALSECAVAAAAAVLGAFSVTDVAVD